LYSGAVNLLSPAVVGWATCYVSLGVHSHQPMQPYGQSFYVKIMYVRVRIS